MQPMRQPRQEAADPAAGLPGRFAAAMAALGLTRPGALPGPLLVAVSGGGDSMALLHLLRAWSGEPRQLLAVVVDHGLRPESAAEAAQVANRAAALEIPWRILRRDLPLAGGGLQAAARDLRYRLLAHAAAEAGAAAIFLAHTRGDQIETLAMRQSRGSGPAGLGGMAPVSRRRDLPGGPLLLRPLLGFEGAELRRWLGRQGIGWLDDPSNRDRRFERVRLRQDLQSGARTDWAARCRALAGTAAAARHQASARDSAAADLLAIALTPSPHGDDRLSPEPLTAAGDDLACHALRGLLGDPAQGAYPPRRAAVRRLWHRLRGGAPGATLAGRRFLRLAGGDYLVLRDRRLPLPALALRPGLDLAWGDRFRLRVADLPAGGAAAFPPGLDLRELGPVGLRRLDRVLPGDMSMAGIPAAARPGLPAIFAGPALVGLPTAGRVLPCYRGIAARVTLSRLAIQPFAERCWDALPDAASVSPPGDTLPQDRASALVRRCGATYLE